MTRDPRRPVSVPPAKLNMNDWRRKLAPNAEGEIWCVTCGKLRTLERLSSLQPVTYPPGAPWHYPDGWLYGVAGWYCSTEHVVTDLKRQK